MPTAVKHKLQRPRRGAPWETRQRLVAAAALLFNRHGYHGTDSNQIAHQAGYATGVFYKHFRNKREMFLAVYENWSVSEWQEVARVMAAGGSNRQIARRLVAISMEFHNRWRGMLASLRELVFSDPVVRKFHRRQRRKQLDRMAELRRKRGTRPRRKEEDLIHLYTTERTYDAIAQGDLRALGLSEKFFIEAMVQNVTAALN
ncbi:MAG TPA: TetR/AcrR family transcriptional regulator [Candidatus Acidoferrum sp.]|nr:TetR/AcrR family transcriptional regulator [Candidatus Acidoferrum sp.]